MKLLSFASVVGFVFCTAPFVPASAASVRVGEGKLELPTYVLGQEDPNPPFPLLTGHSIYPYTIEDDLTDRVETKGYRAIFLENEYLKVTVLPEMGGRLYSLYDKLNKREVFYRNRVVKYGLVAVRGAWISGGVEFNFPDGHTAVTVSPVASTTRENPDGSATVIVGDLDLVSGMHWEVALTLRPREARLEQQVTLFNPTALPHLYWYWANAAVPPRPTCGSSIRCARLTRTPAGRSIRIPFFGELISVGTRTSATRLRSSAGRSNEIFLELITRTRITASSTGRTIEKFRERKSGPGEWRTTG